MQGSSSTKLAVTDLLLFIVMLVGLVVPDKSPLQSTNSQSVAGEAVMGTTVPEV